jgi:hypothetical protein
MCGFPAAELIRMRRQVADRANESQDPAFVSNCAGFVKGVDDLRLAHEDVDGCRCWYEALKGEGKK